MKTSFLQFCLILISSVAFSQTGHLMQGIGAVNMSMGGASTAQPLDINGAMQWNPAALSTFHGSILRLDVGSFYASPELSSSLPAGAMWPEDTFYEGSPASPPVSGVTQDDKGASIMPALGYMWGKADSKHTFGISAFGVSGFGVDFPQETNLPMDANGNQNPYWDPNNSNPVNYPQSLRGFGHVESSYMLLQIGFTWAYEISEKFSIGIQPTFNYSALELGPNPLAVPDQMKGYPNSEQATSLGFGGQIGLFYDTHSGFKIGASYKTPQYFGEFDFESYYLDGSAAENIQFTMNYPAIYSAGLGYSKSKFDFALDYRYVDYKSTEGFEKMGWAIADNGFPTGAVNGFGWENISIISAGLQYKGINKLPLRIGYTYSGNPINEEMAMFSIPATAVIANAFQFGLSYQFNDKFTLDAVYHYGISDGKTTGNLLSPMPAMDFNGDGAPDGPWDATNNPLGKIPDSEVAYDMTTSMFMIGVSFTIKGE
jgi:long-chain fatty acid transport protein